MMAAQYPCDFTGNAQACTVQQPCDSPNGAIYNTVFPLAYDYHAIFFPNNDLRSCVLRTISVHHAVPVQGLCDAPTPYLRATGLQMFKFCKMWS